MTVLMKQAMKLPALLLAMALGFAASAAELDIQVQSSSGAALADAVLMIPSSLPAPAAISVEIDQVNKSFVPFLTVVPVDSKIRFPNRDNIRHHVYSFSEAKKFELKLYSGVPSEPVVFDKPGVVTLGCNIHDSMIAHVVIVDTPWHTRSDSSGHASLQLPPGQYELRYWHPDLGDSLGRQTVTVPTTGASIRLTLTAGGAP